MAGRRGPQVDEGNFTRIHNDLLELFSALPFTCRQLKIVIHIVRMSYGFNRTSFDTTLYDVAAASALMPHHARAAMLALEKGNVIVVMGDLKGRQLVNVSLQKYFSEWSGEFRLPVSLAHRYGHRFSDSNGDQSGETDAKKPPTHRKSDQNSDSNGDSNGENSASKPASEQGSSDPKDMEKKLKTQGDVYNPPEEVHPAFGSGAPPPDAPEPPLVGMDMLVREALKHIKGAGLIATSFQLRDLRNLCETTGASPPAAAAYIAEWAREYEAKGQAPPPVGSVRYFLPVIKNRLAVGDPAGPALDPFADYNTPPV